MKKVIFSLAVVLLSSLAVQAQNEKGFTGEVGANLAIPANNFSGASIGAGIDLLGQYMVSTKVGLTADVGYTSIFAKGGGDNLGIIPIRAGIRFYPTDKFYLAGKGGIGILTGGGSSITATAYSFGAGYFISPAIDLGATYDGYSKNGSFGLVNIRLAYKFGQ